MKVTYFGVRGSCPCSSDLHRRYGGNTSCVLVELAGEPPLILDLGTGVRALGQHLDATVDGSRAPWHANVLLSHLHYDHVLGLPFFAPLRSRGTIIDVYGPGQAGSTLAEQLGALVRPPYFPIRLGQFAAEVRCHDLDGTGSFAIGRIGVTARSIPHRGTTMGFRIEAGGRSVAYLPDHQAPVDQSSIPPEVLELCSGVDLLIHDAQYTEDEFSGLSDWGHSTDAYAVRVASEAGARRLALFHHDPSHGDQEVDDMLQRARGIAAHHGLHDVTAATEGSAIDLGEG